MFSKKNINFIPIEETSHSAGSRKMIAGKPDVPSPYFEALTYGYLPANEKWGLHQHEDITEICIVIKGSGVVRDRQKNEEAFESGDRFIFPTDTFHEIENTSKGTAEFYFIRLKSR
jgi:mannose-6-phosphate isomerase-like protein (cupin superfamily)